MNTPIFALTDSM